MYALVLLCSLIVSGIDAQSSKPNIIFILMDDLGWDDMSWKTDQIKTPTMQKYKDEGQVLEYYYAQCVCSATRTSILSSRYPLHTGINNWIPNQDSYGLPLKDKTIADLLLANGYETHAIGKWHAGFYKWSYTPTYRGFQSFYGYYGVLH